LSRWVLGQRPARYESVEPPWYVRRWLIRSVLWISENVENEGA
jgi:hypothetical protein